VGFLSTNFKNFSLILGFAKPAEVNNNFFILDLGFD
jgi:hypothetical protein